MSSGARRGRGSGAPAPSRTLRLMHGFVAHLFQLLLGIIQQIALVPVFLLYWSNETLAAWLVFYAVGPLALMADFGLHFHAITFFLKARHLMILRSG